MEGFSEQVGEADRGTRLDLWLAERLALSRAQVRRLLGRGAVRLDGRAVGASDKGRPLDPGLRIDVEPFRPPQGQRVTPEPEAPLAVLASGPGWLALDKPAGVPVHPYEEAERGTLLGAAIARHPGLAGVGEGGLRSGVVHRLDVDTSGALLLATEEPAWQRLRDAFREHRVEKTYRAIVKGRVSESSGAELALVISRHRPAKVRVLPPEELARARGARLSTTSWRPLAALAGATLLEVRPVSGFLHQIRAVLAHCGHPILGDRTYADRATAARAPRQMLHAARVAFEEVEATSPDPADFAATLSACEGA